MAVQGGGGEREIALFRELLGGGGDHQLSPSEGPCDLRTTEAPVGPFQFLEPVIRVVCRACGLVLSPGAPGELPTFVLCARCERDTRPPHLEYFPAVPQEPRGSENYAQAHAERETFLAYLRGLGLWALPVVLFVPSALLWAFGARAVGL